MSQLFCVIYFPYRFPCYFLCLQRKTHFSSIVGCRLEPHINPPCLFLPANNICFQANAGQQAAAAAAVSGPGQADNKAGIALRLHLLLSSTTSLSDFATLQSCHTLTGRDITCKSCLWTGQTLCVRE